ncbi:mucin-19-like isoform X2 [Mercenaria mercenaria]|uniref:mucin-19-like isoform X2 n=1 Tax=Mercenaria mercenaria TaxID=6596 RepID=UPI00234E5096|nr:mucin-19-like isoform X2 [Mercenaria mercenaria]
MMWGQNSSRMSRDRASRSNSKSKLNSTVPILPSSPMVTRRRHDINSSFITNQNGAMHGLGTSSKNAPSGTGPLLSSPFMPQIKRALGLEPKLQNRYGEQRRHSFGIGTTAKSPTVAAGSLPHVRLSKTRRLSLSERNSSMLNKSSTVKIAPPVIGKVASPSLYHMRCNSSIQEDRGTPDTYAVISALKERRKRSINTFEEHTEPPQQQAKRRRQESQHSNASTSSMPSMPENFPDLSNADFSMRLDTPGLKRPSRPRQEDIEEWNNMNSSKQHHHEGRNNSILSSLSSSQRFIENQKSKRKAESSFHEKENDSYVAKSQKKEPPKLTHLDVQYNIDNTAKTSAIPQVKEKSPQMTNGHSTSISKKGEEAEKTSQSMKTVEPSKPPVLPKMPSMKKTASIYSGLSSPASFKKAQYANVVATLDDYDADREAENQRVKQMLKDLDESFSKKEAKKETPVTSTSTLSTVTTTVSVATSTPVSVATSTSVSVARSTSAITLETTKPSSVLSALEKLSKSPIQETGGITSTAASTTQPSVSFKPLFGTPSAAQSTVNSVVTGLQTSMVSSSGSTAGTGILGTSQPAVSTGTKSSLADPSTSTPGGFTFNIQKSVGGMPTPVGATAAATSFVLGGTQVSSQRQPSTGVGIVFGAPSTTSAAPSQTQSSTGSGFSFGSVATSTAPPSGAGGFSFAGAQSAPSTTATTTTTKAPGFGFAGATTTTGSAPAATGFGFNTGSVQTSAAPSAGFSFASQPATTMSAATGFSFASAGSTAPSAGGFTLGGQAAPAVTTVASSQFGTSSAVSGPTFNFGGATSTAASGLFGASSGSTSAPGAAFAFGAKPSTTAVASPFGTPAASTAQSPFAAPASTSQTPFGAPGSTAAAFSFGAAKTTASASPFAFNAGSVSTSAGSTPFQTGQTTGSTPAATGLFSFGGATSSQSVFGAVSQSPAFGSTSQTPAFGTTGQTPAFGATNPAPAFGSTSQTPAFGSASQIPAFGSTNQPPAFGAANQPPAFGSATPTFGAATNQKPNTPVFGATSNNTSGSVFGNTGSTATGFAKSHSMPVFATSQDNASSTGTFNFGGPAPNVNPFGQGQTTPAKQTGAAFGQVSNDTTPKAQTGSMFNFGQTNNSAVKGFDFSASAAPCGGQSGTGGFNFMASASNMPVFNFGSAGATPTAGPGLTPGTFAVGAGSTAPRPPRAVARAARRRTQRK